ncbi:MAG: hypothetical protein H6867_06830 [Rhodospirillales bacterium]|nr:hypothetical protein [Rhodospirillales bacterium]MCB9995264.1 hypothetical protein [Rhodospirillales bacterium]
MNIIDKIRNMSPLGRHFTSAAIGAGAYGVAAAAGIPFMGLVVGLGGSFLTNAYSDPSRGNFYGYSTDSLKNFGSLIAGYFLAGPMLAGAFMNAAHAGEMPVNQIESPTPIVEKAPDFKPLAFKPS